MSLVSPADEATRAVLPGLSGQDVIELLVAQLGVANLPARTAAARPSPDRTYTSNAAFWQDALADQLWGGAVVRLEGFYLSEWLPLRPGLFHHPEAAFHRDYAHKYTLIGSTADRDAITAFERELGRRISPEVAKRLRGEFVHVYRPDGKVRMLRGGVGCIRLKDKRVDGKKTWFMGASSTPIGHEGLVVALTDDDHDGVMEKVLDQGALRATLIGRMEFLPADFDPLFREVVGVPQLYLAVEELKPDAHPTSETFVATGAVMVRTGDGDSGQAAMSQWDVVPGVGAAYVSFAPRNVKTAAKWLAETYVAGVMGGTVMTNFDETTPQFRNAEFSLGAVFNHDVSASAARALLERAGASAEQVNLVVGKIEGGLVMGGGDMYITGTAGQVGRDARAEKVTVNAPTITAPNPDALAAELKALREYLSVQGLDADKQAALGVVAEAELKAEAGDSQAAMEELETLKDRKGIRDWLTGAATTIGTTVAAAALKAVLGI